MKKTRIQCIVVKVVYKSLFIKDIINNRVFREISKGIKESEEESEEIQLKKKKEMKIRGRKF